ncbi:hypothetical protein Aduo_012354 [Ancylostoma duodenale]
MELTSSKAPFMCNNDAMEAFERLKEAMTIPTPASTCCGEAHLLHGLFSCYEKAVARPPREQRRKVGFPYQLEQNPEARLLRSVVRDLPHAVEKISFDNVYHLAQLIAISLCRKRSSCSDAPKEQQL